jgi:signal transduction histidine kinase
MEMRLSEFLARDMEAILAMWDKFAAAQLPAAAGMDASDLRDHAEEILRAVVKDIMAPQTAAAQSRKSMGRALRLADAPETAAETHAFLRAQSGFDINQMASEYRALRASVLHLWARACTPGTPNTYDMVRFNEAIDQAVAESVAFFGQKLTEERNLLLGMMGHDMRSPLDVIQLSATYLGKINAGGEVSLVAARIARSGAELNALLNDLIDFNRTNLGLGIYIAPVAVDLAHLFSEVLEQLRASHPSREIELQVAGDAKGVWDPHRLHQLLGNLVLNALKYGARDAPVRVAIVGLPTEVEFRVHNRGTMIKASTLSYIFEPLVRGSKEANGVSGNEGSLGLGLYIAHQISIAHGGNINARSDELETVFTVRLPRLSKQRPG